MVSKESHSNVAMWKTALESILCNVFYPLKVSPTIQVALDFSSMKTINPLPHNPDLTLLEKKAFENIEGEGENAGNQHFLLFLQCFVLFPTGISITS